MPRRPPLTRLLAVLLLGVTGCTSSSPAPAPRATGPVSAPTPSATVTPAELATCRTLLVALPDEIDPGVKRRTVDGDTGRFAAWGDPAVTLECGSLPGDPGEPPAIVNGVSWTVRDIGAGFRWTTVGLLLTIAVDIPDSYNNGAELVNPLAAPILATVRPGPSPAPSF
ncbi:MAG: DUF3515 family protein [Frankiales bacterium]|nr:DUF3515 family protein [Frankiales bacterium]